MAKCSTCGAEIVWGLTANMKRVPMNPPEKRFVRQGPVGATDTCVGVEDTWLSHFATCPQADQHRKPLPGSTEDYLKED